MSPVAAARSINSRAAARMHLHHVKRNSGASDTIDSLTVATANIYAATKGRDKADRSLADRVVGRETLFDLDDGEKGAADVREIPLDDLIGEELLEYIQLYLTPHPDRGSWCQGRVRRREIREGHARRLDKKVSKEKEAEAEYERRAAKWNDIEATMPAYKSTPSLHRAPAFGREVPDATSSAPKHRRCIPAKTSTRILCLVILFMALHIVPPVIFGVMYSLELKSKHNNRTTVAPDQKAAPSAQTPVFEPNHAGVEITDGPPVDVPPIVAPMTTAAVGEPAENQVAVGDGN